MVLLPPVGIIGTYYSTEQQGKKEGSWKKKVQQSKIRHRQTPKGVYQTQKGVCLSVCSLGRACRRYGTKRIPGNILR